MATQVIRLGEVAGAILEIEYDDVTLLAQLARVDCRTSTKNVRLLVFADDGVTPRIDRIFEPGDIREQNIPAVAAPHFEFEQRVRPGDGATVTVMTRPLYRFEGV